MDKKSNQQEKTERLFDTKYFINLTLCAFLAFAGTYFNMPSRGIIATLPFLLLFSLAAAPIETPAWLKGLMFGLFAYVFSSFDYGYIDPYFYTVLSVLLSVSSSFFFKNLKAKRFIIASLAAVVVLLCAASSFFMFGSYAQGNKADKMLKGYIDKRYKSEAYSFSNTFYDRLSKTYKVKVTNSAYPTGEYSLEYKSEHIFDNYKLFAQQTLMYNKMQEITKVLRDAFPNDRFNVEPIKINGYPYNGHIDIQDKTNFDSAMIFRIDVPGVASKDDFTKRARAYYRVLANNDIDFYKVAFVGKGYGTSVLSITVTDAYIFEDFENLVRPNPDKHFSLPILSYEK